MFYISCNIIECFCLCFRVLFIFSFEFFFYIKQYSKNTIFFQDERHRYMDDSADYAAGSFWSNKSLDAILEPFFFWWFSLNLNVSSQNFLSDLLEQGLKMQKKILATKVRLRFANFVLKNSFFGFGMKLQTKKIKKLKRLISRKI